MEESIIPALRILTAGYGNLGFEVYIARLKAHGVTHIVDVRATPWSNYFAEFRRENLIDLVPPTGLRYIYMGDTLGGIKSSPPLCRQDGEIDIQALRSRPELKQGLNKLIEAARSRSICLMCGCLRPEKCHRSWLLGEALADRGVEVCHLNDDGVPLAQSQVMALSAPEQSRLF